MLLDRGFGRSPQQLDIVHNVSDRPLQRLSDETLRLLVENARQLEEGRLSGHSDARCQAYTRYIDAGTRSQLENHQ